MGFNRAYAKNFLEITIREYYIANRDGLMWEMIMKCLIILLLLSMKVDGAEPGWKLLSSTPRGDVYWEDSVASTSLLIDPALFEGTRSYLVQAKTNNSAAPNPSLRGYVPAFQIEFNEGRLKIFKIAIPNRDGGYGLNDLYAKNEEDNPACGSLENLAPRSDRWICSMPDNYQIAGDSLECRCIGMKTHNAFFQGGSQVTIKAIESNEILNPISSVIIQPFSDGTDIDLSGSVFEPNGGFFISGIIDFTKPQGIRSFDPSLSFLILACEQFTLEIKGGMPLD